MLSSRSVEFEGSQVTFSRSRVSLKQICISMASMALILGNLRVQEKISDG
jgi:hypothetical protein